MSPTRKSSTRGALALLAMLCALPMFAARADAQSNSPNEPITVAAAGDSLFACYVPNSGTVYRIRAAGAPSTCTKPTHVQFAWPASNLLGKSRIVDGAPSSDRFAVAVCPTGWVATGGGYSLFAPALVSGFEVHGSKPTLFSESGLPGAWVISFSADNAATVQAHAVCVPT